MNEETKDENYKGRPLKAKEICHYLNICRQTLYKLAKQGKIERTCVGGQVRYILK